MGYFGERPREDLVRGAAQSGTVDAISIRPHKREPVVAVDAWELDDGALDHARRSKRAVTLIAVEDIGAIAATLGREVEHTNTRRNVLVRGVNLLTLIDQNFRIGEVVLRGTRCCDPCERMDKTLGPGGFAAMVGRGGLCASIVETGTIRVGDTIELV
ncbi:MAG: MOSC domain-containing protein [Proteobacteria bacterium]|nr:MOSC domain-containing protein [Pseudomonadota bacterium]MCP4916451.1 MOSC domain-containing protein [Pseudomonadota bacterium]